MKIQKIAECIGHRSAIYALAVGKDERHFLSAGGDGWLTEWDLDDPSVGKVIASIDNKIFTIADMPDKNHVVLGNMTGGVHWIDLNQLKKNRNIQHHSNKGVFDIQYSGNWVFSVAGDGVLTRWSMEGSAIESIQLSNQALRGIAFSVDRALMAIAASDGAIYIIRTENFEVLHTIHNAHLPSVFTVVFSPDGQYLLSGGRDASLRVWDAQSGFMRLRDIPAHLFTINHICYSPDGAYFATASRDKTLKIWDAHSFMLKKVIEVIKYGGHVNSVNRLLWKEGILLSAGDDRIIKMWEMR